MDATEHAFQIALTCANGLSAACALAALITYFVLRRQHSRAMKRVTLKLSACMAGIDFVMHLVAPFGYGNLPRGFTCGFVGGFAFAFPVLASLFYACTIALNCQLVFILRRPPSDSVQRLYVWMSPILSLVICLPTLVAGIYGYDEVYEYCWFSSDGHSQSILRVRRLLTYSLWCILGLAFLIISTINLTYSLFFKHKRTLQLKSPSGPNGDLTTSDLDTQARRHDARRALLIRLLGYIVIPTFCIVPGAIEDVVTTLGYSPSVQLTGSINTVAGLLGMFNAVLFFIDPTVLSIFAFMRKERDRRRSASRRNSILGAPIHLAESELTLGRMETPDPSGASSKTIMITIQVETETDSEYVDCIVDDLKGL